MRRAAAAALVALLLATGAPAAQQPGGIEFKKEAEAQPADLGRVAAAALACLAALGGALWLLRRRIASAPARSAQGGVHVAETLRLAPGTTLHVVVFDGQRLLLAQSSHGVTAIARSPQQQGDGHA